MPRPSFESPRPSKAELSAQEHLDNISFEFEGRLRKNLNAAELSGEGLYPWGEYTRRSEKILKASVPKEKQATPDLSSKTILMALSAKEALPENAADRAALLKRFKDGHTSRSWSRALIALSAYERWAEVLTSQEKFFAAAKTAAFHDWHDAIDFDNLNLPRRDMVHPKKPQVDDLFKYDHLIDEVVDEFVLRGWNIPTTPDNKLDIESLMNRAYQEDLIPETTYQKFENDMAGYFEDELKKKNTTKKQL